jgi:hypothetical protein
MKAVAEILRNRKGYMMVLTNCVLISDVDLVSCDANSEASVIEDLLTLADDYELAFRVYRTCQGLRVICVSNLIRPCAPVARRLLVDTCCDSRFIESTVAIGKFGARLGGKAHRLGLVVPKDFNYYALLPKEQREWDAHYDAVAQNYKACEFILQTSECEMPSEIANFIALHDERTKCFTDLPLA